MRVILYIFIAIPLLTVGQGITDFSDRTSVIPLNENLYAQITSDNVSPQTLSTEPQKELATVKVHPNPSSSDLYVTLTGDGATGKILVYDILGNVIVEGETFELSGGFKTWSHNVSSWHTGTYVVRVLQDGAVVKSLRFIKN